MDSEEILIPTGTVEPACEVPVESEMAATELVARPLQDSAGPSTKPSVAEPPWQLWVSVGGGVGGAAPPTGGRHPSMSVSERREGCGEDL